MILYSRRNLGMMTVPELCLALGYSMTSDDRGKYPSPRIDALQIDFDAALTRAVHQELTQQGRLVSENELAQCVFEAAEQIAAEVEAAYQARKAAPAVRVSAKPAVLKKRIARPIETRPVSLSAPADFSTAPADFSTAPPLPTAPTLSASDAADLAAWRESQAKQREAEQKKLADDAAAEQDRIIAEAQAKAEAEELASEIAEAEAEAANDVALAAHIAKEK